MIWDTEGQATRIIESSICFVSVKFAHEFTNLQGGPAKVKPLTFFAGNV